MDNLDVKLPKFSVSGDLELVEPLSEMGMASVFGPTSNLTGFLDLDLTPELEQNQVKIEIKQTQTYRVFIKYCVFSNDFKILQTLAFLCFLSVSVCVHTQGR